MAGPYETKIIIIKKKHQSNKTVKQSKWKNLIEKETKLKKNMLCQNYVFKLAHCYHTLLNEIMNYPGRDRAGKKII